MLGQSEPTQATSKTRQGDTRPGGTDRPTRCALVVPYSVQIGTGSLNKRWLLTNSVYTVHAGHTIVLGLCSCAAMSV